ncbi:MAG: VOC family protein [Candidatus Paceibacterota bacterium]
MSNRIVHFEIHADDLSRAKDFYTKTFGWEFEEWKGGEKEYWMIMTAPKDSKELGINGGMLKRPEGCRPVEKGQAVTGFACTVVVENYDETAKKILENGGIEAMPKFDLAGMAWQGYFLDTEKNIFGIHEVRGEMK